MFIVLYIYINVNVELEALTEVTSLYLDNIMLKTFQNDSVQKRVYLKSVIPS